MSWIIGTETDSLIDNCSNTLSGKLCLSYCPGKQVSSRGRPEWKRTLSADLDRLKALGVTCVGCLLGDAELRVRNHLDAYSKLPSTLFFVDFMSLRENTLLLLILNSLSGITLLSNKRTCK